jgi:ferredoxin-NADP reductase
MLRHRAIHKSVTLTRLLYSSRAWDEIIYRAELDRLAAADPTLMVTHTLTRSQPPNWRGYTRRIDRAMLEAVSWSPSTRPLTFVCGPTGMVEAVAATLVSLGYDPHRIKTERFGQDRDQERTKQ